MRKIAMVFLFMASFSCTQVSNKEKEERQLLEESKELDISLGYQYIGKAVQKADNHIWGSSPVRGKDGKIHLFVAEWPIPEKREPYYFRGWYQHSRIGHYVSDKPEGPYEFLRIAVPDRDGKFNAPHNPTIQYIDGKYVLCFIVNENNETTYQRIIMYVADDLNDTWRPAEGAAEDGTIFTAPRIKSTWNYHAWNGVSNPSLIKFKDKYMLYYKSIVPLDSSDTKVGKWWERSDFGYGVALADNLEGPYQSHPNRVTGEGAQLEDAYAFTYKEKVYMVSRDYRATLGSRGGGLLWSSDDGLLFSKDNISRAFEDLAAYTGKEALQNNFIYRGSLDGHLERPQLLIENGEPTYMYVATGINDTTLYGSCSHVFKLSLKE